MIQTGRYPHTVTYVSSGNIPSRSANSIQVMKMGQALSRLIKDFNIVTTGDYRTFLAREEFDFSKWYGVDSSIPVVRLPLRLTAKYPLPKGYSHPLFLPAAMAYLLWRRPDFVYTRRSEIARWTIRLGIPVLLESHDPVDSDSSWLIAAAANDLLLGLVTISPILSDTYIRFGIPERMVLSEADGVDIERFGDNLSKVAARMKLFSEGLVPNGNPTSKIVMYAGNLDQDRRIEDLFYCAKKLPNFSFWLVGGWEQSIADRKRQVAEAQSKNIHFTGFVDNTDLPKFLQAADVLVMHYSRKIGTVEYMSPLKMFEYMASGRAILATDLPAIKTTLKHGKNAWLVEPDDEIALLAGLRHLLSNDDTCESLGAQAKSDVTKHTWDQRASRIMGHFFSKCDGEFGKSVPV